jgi:hypothetical protein
MLNELDQADRVLLICNEAYAQRADRLHGGVGWEIMIIQGDLNFHRETTKYIAIVRPTDLERGFRSSCGRSTHSTGRRGPTRRRCGARCWMPFTGQGWTRVLGNPLHLPSSEYARTTRSRRVGDALETVPAAQYPGEGSVVGGGDGHP